MMNVDITLLTTDYEIFLFMIAIVYQYFMFTGIIEGTGIIKSMVNIKTMIRPPTIGLK